MTLTALLVVALTIGPSVVTHSLNPSTTVVDSTAELQSAIDASNGGTIQLAPGAYGSFEVSGKTPDAAIVITSQFASDRAVVDGSVLIDESSNITLTGIRVDPSSVDRFDQWDQAVLVQDSAGITIDHVRITGHTVRNGEGTDPSNIEPGDTPPDAIVGYGFGLGLAVRYSQNVTIDSVELHELAVGAFFQNSEQVEASNLHIFDIRKDGIDLEDLRQVTIERSTFEDFFPFLNTDASDSDHADMIQYWGVNSEWGIQDLTISENSFLQGDGDYTQTIFGALSGGDPDEISFSGFDIRDNLVVNSHTFGVHLGNATNSEIHHNLLIPSQGYPGSSPNDGIPRVELSQSAPASTGNRVFANILVRAWWQDDDHDYFSDAIQTNTIGANTMLEEAGEDGSFLDAFPHIHDPYEDLPDLEIGQPDLITEGHGPRWLLTGLLPFSDIADSVFVEDIAWMADSGITAGCSATRFCPDEPVTRGQMAAFFTRAFALPAAPSARFSDTAGSVFAADINSLAAAGITQGCTATRFCPDEPITRGQMAAFFHRASRHANWPSGR